MNRKRHGDTGRELAVLVGGPRANRWYWRDELEVAQAAARVRGKYACPCGCETRSDELVHYKPTSDFRPNPIDGQSGREWRYQPPEEVTL